jgi:hypothetical protein
LPRFHNIWSSMHALNWSKHYLNPCGNCLGCTIWKFFENFTQPKNNMKTFGFMLFTLIWNSKDNHHLLMYYCEINCHNNWSKVLLTTFLFLSSSSLPFCYFFSFSSMKTQSHKFVFIMNHKVVPWLSKLSTSCFGFYLVLHMNWSSICFFIKKLFPKLQALNYYFKLI